MRFAVTRPTSDDSSVPATLTQIDTIAPDAAPGLYDQGWKDTVFLNKGENVQLAIRFSNYPGRYVFHCHDLEHGDMGMMANFQIG